MKNNKFIKFVTVLNFEILLKFRVKVLHFIRRKTKQKQNAAQNSICDKDLKLKFKISVFRKIHFEIRLTTGFHDQTLMAILKVKTSRHIFPVVCA